ncbi:MAG: type IIL restriction-modification enzyme MmeI, partial [Flavobacterium sp.]
HQMNMLISNEFGQYFARLPLKKSAKIVHGDALEVNWETLKVVDEITLKADQLNFKVLNEPILDYGTVNVIAKDALEIASTKDFPPYYTKEKIRYDYIIGNPPFIGSKIMSQFQRNQIIKEFNNSKGCGVLDYVSGWYLKAAKYIQGTTTKVAFVSTNSVVQGEQTAILWGQMINKYGVKIHFAHRTFKWSNEAKGNAAVYCIIVGFANFETKNKVLFEYEDIKGEPQAIQVKNINPYLVDAKDIFIEKRRKPICNIPEISFGNMPNDGGNFFINENDIEAIKSIEPKSIEYIKPFIGAQEFLNGQEKYCYWFENVNPKDFSLMPLALQKVKAVEKLRASSSREATRKLALYPSLFGEIRQPRTNYILIPRHSSENRKYIPFGYLSPDNIVGDTCLSVENVTLFHFGIIHSLMHFVWIKTTCGRIKSDFRYSNEIVYNNYPWPENPSEKQVKTIEEKAQQVLDVRASFPTSSLADLYNPLTMPPALVKAHNELDKAVDAAYSKQAFTSEAKRMEFLFELYEKYTAGLFVKEKKIKNK